jgi:hypothetical protein
MRRVQIKFSVKVIVSESIVLVVKSVELGLVVDSMLQSPGELQGVEVCGLVSSLLVSSHHVHDLDSLCSILRRSSCGSGLLRAESREDLLNEGI